MAGAPITNVWLEGLPDRIRAKTGMAYDEIQLQAILTAVQSKVLVLTGGPGTGKTTTTLGIITAFREAGAEILLAAPTGRAAKRLAETTGISDCCHARSDDALRHAAAESNIHRHYAGEERARYCRNQEGSCNGCTDGDSH